MPPPDLTYSPLDKAPSWGPYMRKYQYMGLTDEYCPYSVTPQETPPAVWLGFALLMFAGVGSLLMFFSLMGSRGNE